MWLCSISRINMHWKVSRYMQRCQPLNCFNSILHFCQFFWFVTFQTQIFQNEENKYCKNIIIYCTQMSLTQQLAVSFSFVQGLFNPYLTRSTCEKATLYPNGLKRVYCENWAHIRQQLFFMLLVFNNQYLLTGFINFQAVNTSVFRNTFPNS